MQLLELEKSGLFLECENDDMRRKRRIKRRNNLVCVMEEESIQNNFLN
jgi:hypothetical protein